MLSVYRGALMALLAGTALTFPALADPLPGRGPEMHRGEVRRDSRELRQDRSEVRRDRRELRDDRRQVREDIRAGDKEAARDDIRETREDRQELREDRREKREDRTERREDAREKMREACKNGNPRACAEARRRERMMRERHETLGRKLEGEERRDNADAPSADGDVR